MPHRFSSVGNWIKSSLEAVLKQTKEARVFRRAQAVREVVAGHHVNAVSTTFHLTNSALRTWVHETKRRLRPGHLPAIFTDAYEGYKSAILATFGRRYPASHHGPTGRSRRLILRWPQGLAYGQVKKHYKGRGIEWGEIRAFYGKARLQHVLALLGYKQMNTSVIKRHNGTSRLRHQRKVRKTLVFSKVPRYHRWMSWLSVGL